MRAGGRLHRVPRLPGACLGRSHRGGVRKDKFGGRGSFFLNETWRTTPDPKHTHKKILRPNWKRPWLVQSSCLVVPPKTKTKQFKRKPGAGAQAPSLPNAPVFRVQKRRKGGGRLSPSFPNRLRKPQAPPRPSAGESPRPARLPAPLLRGKATPQLCAPARLAAPAAPPPPPSPRRRPAPLLERNARGRERRVGRRAERPRAAAPGEGARVPAPGASLSRGGGLAGPIPRPAPPQRSGCPSLLRPAAAGPATLFPGSARDPPWRPPRAPLRERGAAGHLTARPVNERRPCAPSPPAAAWPRAPLAWGGAPLSSSGSELLVPGASTRMGVPRKHHALDSDDPEV